MGSVGLLYVGAILFVNGIALLGHISGKGAAPLNFFVGGVQVVLPTLTIFAAQGDMTVIYGASGLYLFGFTYIWNGLNSVLGWDGRGLGWFSLFVVFAAIGFAIYDAFIGYNLASAVMWLMWGVLWLMFFLMLALGKDIAAMTGWVAAVEGITTGFLPAMLMLTGFWTGDAVFAIALALIAVLMLILMVPAARGLAAKSSPGAE